MGSMVSGLSCWIAAAGLVATCIGLLRLAAVCNKQEMPFLTEGVYCAAKRENVIDLL